MKKLIFRLLCNSFTGKIISIVFKNNIPNCKHGFKRYKTPNKYCTDTVRAMIFWGFYEGAEIRLIKKYFPNDTPVIELGSSLGIISSTVISCLNENILLTCVEANPHLQEYININISKHNLARNNFKIISAAIAYNTNGFIDLNISNNNTASSIVNNADHINLKTTKVKAITLDEIINIPYTLICDIEGAEIDILKNDIKSLMNCKHLFIELHKTNYNGKNYGVSELKEIILSELGFKLVEQDGNVFYFKNK